MRTSQLLQSVRNTVLIAAITVCAPLSSPGAVYAQDERARLSPQEEQSVIIAPLTLSGGATLTVISPDRWEETALDLAAQIRGVHNEYAEHFGELPAFVTSVRLIERELFLKGTGAPYWTNALYYKGEILLPVSRSAPIDMKDLTRAVRHEYTHAIVHALSDGKCPGWLDEGLAQWAEGPPHRALPQALDTWLIHQPPVPLALLQGGFTKLKTEMVAPAYAQSLFSAHVLMDSYGFKKLRSYLDKLANENTRRDAFKESFGLSEREFERALGTALTTWARSDTPLYSFGH
jgi:hypothetical protein